jgi:hypothetical protein
MWARHRDKCASRHVKQIRSIGVPSHKRVAKTIDPRKAMNSAIAMDVGKEMVAYLEVMYPDVFEVMNSGCKLSIRNHIHNDIIAALEIVGTANHLERLKERAEFRRKWVAAYRNIYRNRPKKLKAK